MSHKDEANLKILLATTGGLPYKPPTYTCIKEFTDNFPKKKATEFVQEQFLPAQATWIPEAPYPQIYTEHYKKTLLSTL